MMALLSDRNILWHFRKQAVNRVTWNTFIDVIIMTREGEDGL